MTSTQLRIAVLVPCYNEEAAVATVVADFRKALPSAEIYVFDNNSRDRTAEVARKAGAIVRSERRQGKGHVVRRMFADVEADIFVLDTVTRGRREMKMLAYLSQPAPKSS